MEQQHTTSNAEAENNGNEQLIGQINIAELIAEMLQLGLHNTKLMVQICYLKVWRKNDMFLVYLL